MLKLPHFHPATRPAMVLAAILTLAGASAGHAQTKNLETEIEAALGLIELGFPDFAEKVLAVAERDIPGSGPSIQVARANVLIARRRFADVEALLAQMPPSDPKTQAINLALGEAYARSMQNENADRLFNKFFAQYKDDLPEDPDLLRSFQQAAYILIQIRRSAGQYAGAAQIYEMLLKTKMEEGRRRMVRIELAEMKVQEAERAAGEDRQKALDRAWKICEDVQFGGYDLWFGRSISIMANIQVLRGREEEARKLLRGYMADLRQIDDLLVQNNVPRSQSPMATARFLLGELYLNEAAPFIQAKDKGKAVPVIQKALQELVNVYIKYPDSDRGPQARMKTLEVAETLKREFGIDYQPPVVSGRASEETVRQAFATAHSLFARKQWQEAAVEYINVLNIYPDYEASVEALGFLLMCYAEAGDGLMLRVAADHIAERFSNNGPAGMALLRAGKHYFDKGDKANYYYLYEKYVEFFSRDERAPQILWTLASIAAKNGEPERERGYMDALIKRYPQSPVAAQALSRSAFVAYSEKRYEEAIPELRTFIATVQPGFTKAQGQFFIASSLSELGRHAEALAEYTTLISWLAPTSNNPFRGTLEEEKVLDLLEKSVFFRGFCQMKIKEPADKVKAYREDALKTLTQFATLFPDSELQPKALRLKGAVLLELGRDGEAGQVFTELSQKFPDTEEGKNAFFYVVDSFIEMGQFDKARAAFANMMQNAAAYTPEQYVAVGESMMKHEFFAEAEQAYSQVLGRTQARVLLERALYGVGLARFKVGKLEEAVEPLQKFVQEYPKSAFYYDVRFVMAGVFSQLGRFDEAMDALRDIFTTGRDALLINRANLEFAQVARRRERNEEALAAYLRVSLLADAQNKDVRPLVQQALLEGIELATAMQRWKDVEEQANQFVEEFADSPELGRIREVRNQARQRAGTP